MVGKCALARTARRKVRYTQPARASTDAPSAETPMGIGNAACVRKRRLRTPVPVAACAWGAPKRSDMPAFGGANDRNPHGVHGEMDCGVL